MPIQKIRQMVENTGKKPNQKIIRDLAKGFKEISQGNFTVYLPDTRRMKQWTKKVTGSNKKPLGRNTITSETPISNPVKEMSCWRCHGKDKNCKTCNGSGVL